MMDLEEQGFSKPMQYNYLLLCTAHVLVIFNCKHIVSALDACPAKDTSCIAADGSSNVLSTTTDAENIQECASKFMEEFYITNIFALFFHIIIFILCVL